MSELGSSAAVGIESVEWIDAGGGTLTVRVTGRWRRRRPATSTPAVLVLETEGRRHRFPAMPEPPSLAGAAPGTWRLSFAVPGELAPELRDAWLTLGVLTVALPVPDGPRPTPAPVSAEPLAASDALASGERPGPGGEEPPARAPADNGADAGHLEIERAWQRADDAERVASELGARVSELERVLAARGAAPPQGLDSEADRLRFEDVLRERLAGERRRVPREPAASWPASPALAAPEAMPELRLTPGAAIGAAAEASGSGPADVVAALRRELYARVTAEAGLRARTVQAETRLAARVLIERRTSETLRELAAELATLRELLTAERTRRREAEAELVRLREELGGQRTRSLEAHEAITMLRSALGELRPAPGPAGPPSPSPSPSSASLESPAGEVRPERLSDALARLRETTEPREPAPVEAEAPSTETETVAAIVPVDAASAAPTRSDAAAAGGTPRPASLSHSMTAPTLEPAFRRLLARDRDAAGRLLLALLGGQRHASPQPIAYDLVLGPGHGVIHVTVASGQPLIERSGAERPPRKVNLQLLGEPGRIARLLVAGPLRRRLRVGLARVHGQRERLSDVAALLSLPLDPRALLAAGARPDVESLIALVSAMVDPAWTRGERFAVAFRDDSGRTVHLQIRDGSPPLVTLDPPRDPLSATVTGPAGVLAAALSGATPGSPAGADEVTVAGDARALARVREWVQRAVRG